MSPRHDIKRNTLGGPTGVTDGVASLSYSKDLTRRYTALHLWVGCGRVDRDTDIKRDMEINGGSH